MRILSMLLLALAVGAVSAPAQAAQKYDAQYAIDRAEIADLEARYMFALDWQDADAYAATFTEDGVLDWAGGVARGREAIRKEVQGMKAAAMEQAQKDAPTRPSTRRHFITNSVVKIDGDHATQVAYWFETLNDSPDRKTATVPAYGHYVDTLRRVDGRWLFSSRKIFNEVMDDRAAGPENPAR